MNDEGFNPVFRCRGGAISFGLTQKGSTITWAEGFRDIYMEKIDCTSFVKLLVDNSFSHEEVVKVPDVKGTLWTRVGLGIKVVYSISLTKKYIMDMYENCTISYLTYIIA